MGSKDLESFGRIVHYMYDLWEYNSVYEGQLKNGIPHGFGWMITAQTEQIIGYFKEGRPCGKVIFIDQNH